jgi:Tfp pilus assembly protein PilN
MIQFNLLPDIKIQYLKARRQKHLIMLSSTVVIIFSVTLVVVLVSIVFGLQKKNIADLSKDITSSSTELKNTKNLDRMLTVQNQLNSLQALHDEKPVASRLYKYITQLTPTSASIARMNIDFAKNTLTVNGAADSLGTINTFTDGLKFATYHTEDAPKTEKKAFSSVVLSTFGRDTKTATYTIDASFDPVLFSEKSEVTLTVPNITTRTGVLFKDEGGQ